MHTPSITDVHRNDTWRSLRWKTLPGGYAVNEVTARLTDEAWVKRLIQFVGISIILAGYFLWFVPINGYAAEAILAKAMLSVIFACGGLGLYVFAKQRGRNGIRVNMRDRTLVSVKLCARDRERATTDVPITDIDSLFVRRGGRQDGLSELCMRTSTPPQERCLMRGEFTEVELLHRQLCVDIRKTQKPRRKVNMRPAPKAVLGDGTARPDAAGPVPLRQIGAVSD